MRVLGHIWAVLTNLFAIVVLLAMFSTASSHFETVVVSALALIYLTIISSVTLLSRQAMELAQLSLAQFISIAKQLHDPETNSYEESLKEATENYRKVTIRYYINVGFNLILWLITVWNLLAVTVFRSN